MTQNKPNLMAGVLFVFFLLFNSISYAQEQEYVVASQRAFLREKPSFLAKSIGPVAYGTKVNILKTSGDWRQITLNNKLGWIHKSSLQDGYFILKELGSSNAKNKNVYKDEVVAAGKGFSPEYESLMKSKNPNLNYQGVDKMEAWKISVEGLVGFGNNGGLKSEVLK